MMMKSLGLSKRPEWGRKENHHIVWADWQFYYNELWKMGEYSNAKSTHLQYGSWVVHLLATTTNASIWHTKNANDMHMGCLPAMSLS